MIKQLFKLCVVAFAFSGIANANHEGMKSPATSGNFMGGIGHSWVPNGANGSQFFIDGLHLKNRFEVSPKVSVVLHNAFAVNSVSGGGGNVHNGGNYFSTATLTNAAGSSPTFGFSNLAAYIQHECSKTMTWAFGHMRTGLGMESLTDRVDMPTYYYSYAYTTAQNLGMNYDLALKFTLHDVIPGSLELAVLDGRAGRAGANALGFAARWHHEIKSGETTITPVISTVLENWRGGPNNIGITAGAMTKFSSFWLNAEFFFVKNNTAGEVTDWNVMAEPGIDLGMFDLSVKYNFISNTAAAGAAATTDHMIGAAIGKTYDDKHSIKLAYNHNALNGTTAGGHLNDVRLLFSTKW